MRAVARQRCPPLWHVKVNSEQCLQVGLIETGENAAGIGRNEERIEKVCMAVETFVG